MLKQTSIATRRVRLILIGSAKLSMTVLTRPPLRVSNSPAFRSEQSPDLPRAGARPSVPSPVFSSWQDLPMFVITLLRVLHAAYDSGREDVLLLCIQGTRVGMFSDILDILLCVKKVDGSVPQYIGSMDPPEPASV
ncbi:hypothetical protein BS47DRAFT_1166772 [Hydnum rufescens UP504]|uniref:Uncharacterized protein n=1 Tax=Hydnum rufescens UP504 TaxID=1448309 RepID=A0A9P6DVC2_9AGAM|nr:hypothetical protein BS47DRAFT_1166772 [Hydnum rufescens UP504]